MALPVECRSLRGQGVSACPPAIRILAFSLEYDMSIWFHYGTILTRRRIAADIRDMRSRIDELLPIAEENEGFVTAVQVTCDGQRFTSTGERWSG
jgi:hypothetical protein